MKDSSSEIGHDFWKCLKTWSCKKNIPKRFRMIRTNVIEDSLKKSLILSIFDKLPFISFSKCNNFLSVCWFFYFLGPTNGSPLKKILNPTDAIVHIKKTFILETGVPNKPEKNLGVHLSPRTPSYVDPAPQVTSPLQCTVHDTARGESLGILLVLVCTMCASLLETWQGVEV